MKKLPLILAALFTANAHGAAQMWCLNDTTICSYGTPSLRKLDREERKASIYKMYIKNYNQAVINGTFEAVTANRLIELAKESLDPTPDPTPSPTPDPAPTPSPSPTPTPTPTPTPMPGMPFVDTNLEPQGFAGHSELRIKSADAVLPNE